MKLNFNFLSIIFSGMMLSSINSCVRSDYQLQLITDAGTVTDKSFNEQAYNGLKNNIGVKKFKATYGFQRPESNDPQAFLNAYNAARLSGMKTLVASGFYHESWETLQKFINLLPSANYITIDFNMQNSNLKWDQVNVAQLEYRSEESGFFAAIAGATYLNKLYEKNPSKTLKMTTFGGLMIPPVVRFMAGYVMGINWWNQKNNENSILEILKISQPKFNAKNIKSIEFIAGSDSEQFSGSFKANEPNVKNILDRLIGIGKADIIMPVAGPQTSNVINYIKEKKLLTKIIGVDTDQAIIYEVDSNLFVSSALKKVEVSVSQAINSLYNNTAKDFFKKEPVINGIENKWTGIPISQYINEAERDKIYDTFKGNNDWKPLKDIVHKQWEQLNAPGLDFKDIWTRIKNLK